jgi:hypothetical protein
MCCRQQEPNQASVSLVSEVHVKKMNDDTYEKKIISEIDNTIQSFC